MNISNFLSRRLIFQQMKVPESRETKTNDLSTLEGIVQAKQKLIKEFEPQLKSDEFRAILENWHETKNGQTKILETKFGNIKIQNLHNELNLYLNNQPITLEKLSQLFQ